MRCPEGLVFSHFEFLAGVDWSRAEAGPDIWRYDWLVCQVGLAGGLALYSAVVFQV